MYTDSHPCVFSRRMYVYLGIVYAHFQVVPFPKLPGVCLDLLRRDSIPLQISGMGRGYVDEGLVPGSSAADGVHRELSMAQSRNASELYALLIESWAPQVANIGVWGLAFP